jgi:two-component system, cell cycle sensor histidine kinase and response regulator CckA
MKTTWQRLRDFLRFPGTWSDEQQRQAEVLQISFLLMFAAGLVYCILPSSYLNGQTVFYVATMLTGIAGSVLLRFGSLRISGVLSTSALWIVFTVGAYTEGGITSDSFAGNVAIVVFAGLVLGLRGAVLTSAFSIVAGWLLVYLSYHHLLPPTAVTYSQLNVVTDFSMYLAVTALFTGIALHRINQSAARTKQELEERTKAQEALRASEQQYRALYENAVLGIFHSTFDGKFIDVNPALAKLLGYDSPEEVVKSITNIAEQVYVTPPRRNEVARAALQSGGVINVENRYYRKDGSIWDGVLHLRIIFDRQGNPIHYEGFVEDVTERKQAEQALKENSELFRLASSLTTDYIFVDKITEDGKTELTLLIGALEKITGYTEEEFRAIGHWRSTVHPEDLEKDSRDFQKLLNNEKVDSEIRTIHKNGHTTWMRVYANPIWDKKANKLVGISGAVQDITERKQAEEALRQSQRLESIGTLAGGIAHDFNNLLNAVLGQSALALSKLPHENPAASNVGKAIKAAERAADLTRQLLAYSGKGKFVIEEIDLNSFIKENVQILEISIPKTAQLRFTLGSPAPFIHGDMGQLQQVVMNLIINAGEALGENPGTIDIRTDQFTLTQHDSGFWKYTNTPLPEGKYALLQIRDTGHGIKTEVLARIFEPFYSTKFVGRGLGLAAVLGIIKGHQGGIRLESEEGKGTRFDFIFPLVEKSATLDAPLTPSPPVVSGKGKTVLVIDDEPSVLDLLNDILSAAEFTVMGSPNPLEGIETYRRHHQTIKIVILDYSMPGMDGKAAFTELVKINKDVKVLLCSGYAEEQMESSFGDLRPAGFIHKPYKPEALLARLTELLSEDPKEKA